MGRSRYRMTESDRPHFLAPSSTGLLYGYVLLENHLHLIAQADDLNKEIARFKSYTAKMLIRLLQEAQATRVLDQLASCKLRHRHDRRYQVWQEGSHPQLVQTEAVLRQKLDYTHFNPVRRGYVDDPLHWRYSSARNYAGMDALLPVYTAW